MLRKLTEYYDFAKLRNVKLRSITDRKLAKCYENLRSITLRRLAMGLETYEIFRAKNYARFRTEKFPDGQSKSAFFTN